MLWLYLKENIRIQGLEKEGHIRRSRSRDCKNVLNASN